MSQVQSVSLYPGEFIRTVVDILQVKPVKAKKERKHVAMLFFKGYNYEKAQEDRVEVSRCPMCPEEENSNKLLFAMILSLFTN